MVSCHAGHQVLYTYMKYFPSPASIAIVHGVRGKLQDRKSVRWAYNESRQSGIVRKSQLEIIWFRWGKLLN